LFRKKRRKNPKKNAHLHQRNQVFPISTTKTVLNWVLLASAASFPGTERICGNPSLFAGISMIFSVIPGNPSEMKFLFGSVATAEKREVNASGLLLHGLLLIVSILKKKTWDEKSGTKYPQKKLRPFNLFGIESLTHCCRQRKSSKK
jgi:hypothetical protein